MAAHGLIKRGRKAAASYLQGEINRPNGLHQLNELLDTLLNPSKPIDAQETIDWCRWLMAGGRTPDEFSTTVRKYDNGTTCGLVWIANFVAYRCRTCGVSPCMSLCAECFQQGNHEGHDFNMFRSQAGGACDCGDSSVMKESGFCSSHGPRAQMDKGMPPTDLTQMAEAMMPRIFLRLIHHFRDKSCPLNSGNSRNFSHNQVLQEAEPFINMLHQLSDLGAAIRHLITRALTDPQVYASLTEVPDKCDDTSEARYLRVSNIKYQEALTSLPSPDLQAAFKDFPGMSTELVHKTLLEELIFWTVYFEFPQKLVCLLLNMLRDNHYKEAFIRTFVQHYSCISLMLGSSSDSDTLSNRVVHVSVQLYSNEELALKMVTELHLLYVMVGSLRFMLSRILIQNTLHDPEMNFNCVVDCSKDIMKDHCYWPLVSDLNNVLSHRGVACKFMSDPVLLDTWFALLSLFQGMNVNQRELIQHIEFEPNTYFAAFSAELEASASPMWAMISHLRDSSTLEHTKHVLACCLSALEDWFDAIGYSEPEQNDHLQVSFHLPLHRYFAVFLSQAVRNQGADLDTLLPPASMLQFMMMHPLQAQVAFYEILNGLWVRNGLQIKGQAMTYIQCHFCNSMVDADLFLLQVCASRLDPDWFIMTVLERFHVADWISFSKSRTNSFVEGDQEMAMLESCLTFLATILTVRTNTGLTEEELTKQEMVTLLCMGDKTHSQLTELIPEKCGTIPQNKNFEPILSRVANYKAPNFEIGGYMQQGMYVPKDEIWEREYDPIYVLLRAVHRRDYQASMDRFTQYAQQSGKCGSNTSPWPPYRLPMNLNKPYSTLMRLLHCKTMHAIIFTILYKAQNDPNVPETVISLCLFLLEMAIRYPPSEHPTGKTTAQPLDEVADMEYGDWYNGSWILTNIQHTISKVIISHDSGPTVNEDLDEMDIDSYEVLDMEMQEIVNSPSYDIRGSAGDAGMLESSMQHAALPAVNVPLALPAAQTSRALVPVPVLSPPVIAMAQANGQAGSAQPTIHEQVANMMLRHRPARRFPSTKVIPALPTSQQPMDFHPNQEGDSRPELCGRSPPKALPYSFTNVIEVNESTLSLLIKLHSKLAGRPDSYTATVLDDSRIGDGPHFIDQILNRISMLSLRAARAIQEIRHKIWPQIDEHEKPAMNQEKDKIDKDERRRRARERQQKLMAEFASKQKAFMEHTMETDKVGDDDQPSGHSSDSLLRISKEYDCVICNQTTPSVEDRPVGLVTLLQASSVLGHSHHDTSHLVLPCSSEGQLRLQLNDSKAYEMDKRLEEFGRQFDLSSWLMSLNIGWEGGVHVQTCGHHLHLDCHKSYIQSLRMQQSQRQQNLAIDRGEYSCPLCRQLANSVLPVSPDIGEIAAVVKSRPNDQHAVAVELSQLLQSDPLTPVPSRSTNLMKAMGSIMEDMTNTTYPQYKYRSASPCRESLFLFICSIARTNLELEIVQRGGSLCTLPANPIKRRCFVPLLHVLAMHSKILTPKPYTQLWSQITGLQLEDALSSLSVYEKEVPLLLKDMTALLLQLVVTLPVHIDKAYYTCIVQMLYNVVYVQALSQLSSKLTENQRLNWKLAARQATGLSLTTFTSVLGEVIDNLEHSALYLQDDDLDQQLRLTRWSEAALELGIQELCLSFLRIASLLQHHVYKEDLPTSPQGGESEFSLMARYLRLGSNHCEVIKCSASCLTWITQDPRSVVHMWCQDYMALINKSQISARNLLEQLVVWKQPCLLQLPKQYERFFQYYHHKQCRRCSQQPKEPSVCLVCGTMVCLREECCRQNSMFEAVQHSVDCGAGTAIFLAVNSSNVIVIRGKRACLWGSVYLDSYGEEDKDLKRGKPLFLSEERYTVLQQQWLIHSFDHTSRRWVWHKDAL